MNRWLTIGLLASALAACALVGGKGDSAASHPSTSSVDPRRGERHVMYTDFPLPTRAANPERAAKISDIRESAPVTVSQPPGHLGS